MVTGDVVNELSSLVGDPNVTIHEGKAFMCQVQEGRRAREVLARLEGAPRPVAHVGRRERQAAEANIDRGIELAMAAASLDELVVRDAPAAPETPTARDPSLPLDQPEGVYHG